MRQKGVQQRLDRGIGGAGIEQVRPLHAHHLLIREGAAPAQFAQRPEPYRRQPGGLDRRHVPTAALDAKHLDLLVEEVFHDHLDRGVAAAMQHELRLAP